MNYLFLHEFSKHSSKEHYKEHSSKEHYKEHSSKEHSSKEHYKEDVHSFDIFDTLLARTTKIPHDIFEHMNSIYPNFHEIRRRAELTVDSTPGNSLIERIYNKFQEITGESDEKIRFLREKELETEKKYTIPIQSNINKMKPTDIIISDMYLTKEEIHSLLKHHKIMIPESQLFVSIDGKSSGWIYPKLLETYHFIDHLGDNLHSDIEMAKRNGIKGIHTSLYQFSELENILYEKDHALCELFRRMRLANPYDTTSNEYTLYDYQVSFNIPLLLYACHKMVSIMKVKQKTKVLFLSRDGCLMIHLFRLLYPEYESVYFHSSRYINENNDDAYKTYIKTEYNKNCILFDTNGSFSSGRKLFMELFQHLPCVFLINFNPNASPLYDDLHFIYNGNFLHIEAVEWFNQDYIGSIIRYDPVHKDIRLPCEYPIKNVDVYHKTFHSFLSTIKNKVQFLKQHTLLDDDAFWLLYFKNNISSIVPLQIITDWKKNKTSHLETMSLSSLATHLQVQPSPYYSYYEIIIDRIMNKERRNPIRMLLLYDLSQPKSNLWSFYTRDLAIIEEYPISNASSIKDTYHLVINMSYLYDVNHMRFVDPKGGYYCFEHSYTQAPKQSTIVDESFFYQLVPFQ